MADNNDCLRNLGWAVLMQAVRDYKKAYLELRFKKDRLTETEKIDNIITINEVEFFFRSSLIELYTLGEYTWKVTEHWTDEIKKTAAKEYKELMEKKRKNE